MPRHRHVDYNEDRENVQVKKKKEKKEKNEKRKEKKKQWPVFEASKLATQLVAGSATTENQEPVCEKVAVFPLVFRGLRNCNSVGFKWSFRMAIVIDSIIRRLFSPALSARGTSRETRQRETRKTS